MLFNSFEYLLFLPTVFLLYWFVFRSRKWQNLLIVIVSYIFYGWWDWRFLILIAFTSLCSYLSGVFLEKYEGRRKAQQMVSAANITVNLLILCVFKYFNFFTDNLASLVGALGYQLNWVTLDIILPVGISFYTFQALSYTIDVYRHSIKPTRDPVEFFAYISFFPQLVAGPIERATNLLPQFQKSRKFDYHEAVDGFHQILWGLAKKMIIADTCAIVVNENWPNYTELSGVQLFLYVFLFTFQIYCDFSGYSDIAIGTAKLFGIRLMQNFNFPFLARSIPEHWRRWHISLTTWFRDYVYFPLGGSRGSKAMVIRNIFIVWAISGLWHGANWTYICWGLYHGVLIALYNILGINTKYKEVVAHGHWLPSLRELGQVVFTFLLVVNGFIIFRSESISQAAQYFWLMVTRMFGPVGTIDGTTGRALLFCGILIVVEWLRREKVHVLSMENVKPEWIQWAICFVLIIATYVLMATQVSNFIYFQF